MYVRKSKVVNVLIGVLMSGIKIFFYPTLGWTIRDRRGVEPVEFIPFDYLYALFGV